MDATVDHAQRTIAPHSAEWSALERDAKAAGHIVLRSRSEADYKQFGNLYAAIYRRSVIFAAATPAEVRTFLRLKD